MAATTQLRWATNLQPASSGRRPVLSIVIVSWNTSALLVRCLQSLAESLAVAPSLSAEIFVVDNASQDDTVAVVSASFPEVRLIQNSTNIGFAAANNQAMHESTGDYLLLLNPDTELEPGALLALTSFMDATPLAGVAGPLLLNPDGSRQLSTYPFPTLSRELWRMFHLDLLRPYAVYAADRAEPGHVQAVDSVQGACMILRREALNQVGPLDEDYFIYSEEIDLCYRLKQAGWQTYLVPQAKVLHYGGQSTRQVSAEMFFQLYRGKIVYFRKHHGRRAARAYKLILAAAASARVSLAVVAARGPAGQNTQALARNYRHLLALLPRL